MHDVEVRCCCDAHLIGWVPLPGVPQIGKRYVFVLDGNGPQSIKGDGQSVRDIETLTFDCARVEDSCVSYPALKSRDYPIEQMRRIYGFREARPGDERFANQLRLNPIDDGWRQTRA